MGSPARHRRRYQTTAADRALFVSLWPRCFAPAHSNAPKWPLKRDIHLDIIAAAPLDPASGEPLSKSRIQRALGSYTAGPRYAQALATNRDRLDLEGFPVGTVSAVIRSAARAKVKAFNRQNKERAAAEELEAA